MKDAELGRLKEVCVREVWCHEAKEFTPWLSKNLDRLSEVLNIELELEKREKQVGSHRADIVARIPAHGACVLIENQLEVTDLKHLGQILAYLAGLQAQIVVWIASEFKDDHLTAIRWLNQHTEDPFAFFAIRVKAFQIGCSPFAPTFDILESPDEWGHMAKRIKRSIEKYKLQRDFWAHCAARWEGTAKPETDFANSRYRRWVEEADLKVALYLGKDSVRVYVTGHTDEADEDVFARIEPYRGSLMAALDGSCFLDGENPRCRTMLKIDTRDRNNWNAMADWLYDQSRKYESVLRNGPTVTT